MDTNGLVGWWPFDGNANDYSGNGNHGIVNGAVFSAVDRNGNLNACYQWPNTRASVNYINLGTSIQSQLTNSITNSVWVYFDTAATANARIISTWEMGIIVFSSSPDSVTLKCTYDFTGTNMWPSTFKISKHSWHHIVFTSGSGFTRLYVDGQLVEVSSSTVAVQSSPYDWNVGRKSRPAYDGFGGKIDDLGIWNRVLTPLEITNLYTAYPCNNSRSIYYVDMGGDDLNIGSASMPLRNIQTAIDRSCDGDTIIVEQGTYYEKISYLGKSLLVSSRFLFSNLTIDISNTIINGSQDLTSNSGITINGQSDSSYLIGFTVDSVFGSFGGAIRAFGKVKISDCVVSNSTTNGEGCGFYGHGIIENTKFTHNSGIGRGVITAVGNIKLSGCYFYQNTGIALYNWGNDIQIKNCIFNENSGNKGGAIYSTRSGDIEIINSTFYNNSGYNYSSIFITSEAGPILGSKLSVINSILWDSDTTSPLISTGNPIAFGPVNSGATQKINIVSSTVGRGILGINILIPTNLDTLNLFHFSPYFQDITNQNFRLKSNSPLIGLGSNNPSINLDTFLIPQLDYLKNQRIQPLGSIVDLGAIESALDTACQSSLSNIYVIACDSFIWVLNSMTYNASGIYSDTLINSEGCDSIVSLNLTINTLSYQLPQDTITSCDQDSVLLDAGSGFASYNWSNGDSTQIAYANATGMYSMEVTDTNGCTAVDSVFVSIINDSILQNDTIICKGDSLSLSVSQLQPQALTICNGNNLPNNLQTGLVGYWPFCGNANDESGNGNNGTVNGATLTTDRFGNANSAYDFDGVNDYLDFGNPTLLNPTPFSYSQSCWIKLVDYSAIQDPILSKRHQDNGNDWATALIKSDGKVSFFSDDKQHYTTNFATSPVLDSSFWYQFTFVKNGYSYIMYMNGYLVDSIYDTHIMGGTNDNFIAGKQGAWNAFFKGKIDDIGIWNRALSSSEAQQLYSNGAQQTYQWSTGDTTSSILVSPDSTTTYYVTISNGIHSCVDSVTVTVNNPQFQFAQDSVSGCDTVTVNAGSGWSTYAWSSGDTNQSVSFTNTGMKVLTVTDSIGCTATDSIFVTVNTYVTTAISDTSCDQYTWSQTGVTYTITGIYSDTIPTAVGCDSIISLDLVIYNLDTVRVTVVSCDSFNWPQTGQTYYTSGVYKDSLVNNQGCDSILLLDLTITQTTSSIVSVSACDSFTWLLNGMTYNSSGVYSDTITNSQGCDSIVSLNLTINTLSYQLPQDTITSCNQDSVLLDAGTGFTTYNWSNGDSTQTSYVSATGMYSVQVSDSNGCSASDSVFVSIINDTILQNDTTICKGDSISLSVGIPQPTNLLIDSITIRMDSVWDYYFTSLDTTRNYLLKVNGLWANCCGHLNYDVAFGGITWSSISPVIWNSSAIYFHMDGLPFPRPTPDVYSTSHQYDYPLSPSKDSIEISFYDNPTTDNIGALRFRLFQLIDPSSLTHQWSNGDTASSISVSPDSTTTYYVTISNGIHSCVDSVTVTVNNPQFQFAQDSVSGCDTVIVNAGSGWSSYSWSSGETTQSVSFTTSGMKVLTVTDSIGCTATDSIYVTVNTYVTTTMSDTSCDQYTWSQTGITYGTSGVYRDTVPTAVGCDSILELNLVLFNSTSSLDTVVNCESFTWQQTGFTYFTSGIYRDTLVNSEGCDSLLSLVLTINNITYSNTSITACDSFTWTQTNTTYFTSGNYQDTVLNSKGCDSVINLNLLVYPTITPKIGLFQNLCENDAIFNFTASPPGGAWTGPGISLTGLFDPAIAGEGIHTIIYTAVGQCANSDTVLIEVYDIPFINGLIKDDECNEGIGSIKTTVRDGANPYTYLWNDRVNTKDNLGLTEGTYTLTVTDDNGCKGDYVGSLLNLQDDSCDDTYLFVPNIFSPDGNGVNDILFVDGKNIQQVQLMIYNRWGNLVFQSNSVAEGWDGNFKGKPVNQGVFVYIVTGRFKDGKDFDQKGTITLIRKK
ncbi:gliding motility-associated C-terminal domain-containing protein [Flavobacteriales bacterium]|nr:gliding motility-associated C-terminal domain-containing protein [Flavobacteriales bacterium]